MIYANSHPGKFTIKLAPGTYTLTRKGANEDSALTGDLDIIANGRLRIVGARADTTTIDASGLFDSSLGYGDRLFDVHGTTFDLDGVSLTGGVTQTSPLQFYSVLAGRFSIRRQRHDRRQHDHQLRASSAGGQSLTPPAN